MMRVDFKERFEERLSLRLFIYKNFPKSFQPHSFHLNDFIPLLKTPKCSSQMSLKCG